MRAHARLTAAAAAAALLLPLLARAQSPADLQTFTGGLGGLEAPSITFSGSAARPFLVDGSPFPDFARASELTCNLQFNRCQQWVEEQQQQQAAEEEGVTLAACGEQRDECLLAQQGAPVKEFDDVEEADEEDDEEDDEGDENGEVEEEEEEDEVDGGDVEAPVEEVPVGEELNELEAPADDPEDGAGVVGGQAGENIGPDPEFPDFDIICDEL